MPKLRLLLMALFMLGCAGKPKEPAASDSPLAVPKLESVKVFYIGHSLLAGSHASPNHHVPYNIGIFAAAKGHPYKTHGQLGWGTQLSAHWEWRSDDLAQGPTGFNSENHRPFYAGRNGKAELAAGGYNVVVFTDVNGNAKGARKEPSVEALVGFIQLARKQSARALPVLYSCWNELPVADQTKPAAVEAWRKQTLAELTWWESVVDEVNTKIPAPRMLLVPVSAVVAEIAADAVHGRIPGMQKSASMLFSDDVHGTPMTYYAMAAALYAAIFQESPLGATTETVRGNIGGAAVDYTLPSAEVATYLQQRAFDLVRSYPRAGFPR
ncbi:MAG TPA: hypothetical protein VFN67_36875 [Polyangiales bacterium]|nr:hypothetical protein [Polyangiales bacterium]